MSVASEFPPEVVIPERARRTMPGGQSRVRHLSLVPTAMPAGRRVAVGPSGERRFADSQLDWPLSVAPVARPLRLTRRGLAVIVVLTVLLGALLLTVARLSAGSAPGTPAGAVAGTVTVQPGDTLWSIAQRTDPRADPRLVVDKLRKVNHLNSVVLSPGQTLNVG